MPSIEIINETSLTNLVSQDELSTLVSFIQSEEKCSFESIEYVFVSEEKIVEINRDYLKKDYVTDIITFRVDDIDDEKPYSGIEGSICICLARVYEQAEEFKASEKQELMRVCVHGLLHLSGYEDADEKEKKLMREKEDYYLKKMNLI
jgi:rRNA maturation RNase YbeY